VTKKGGAIYACVPPNIIILAFTLDDYWATLARVEDDQRGSAPPRRKRRGATP